MGTGRKRFRKLRNTAKNASRGWSALARLVRILFLPLLQELCVRAIFPPQRRRRSCGAFCDLVSSTPHPQKISPPLHTKSNHSWEAAAAAAESAPNQGTFPAQKRGVSSSRVCRRETALKVAAAAADGLLHFPFCDSPLLEFSERERVS